VALCGVSIALAFAGISLIGAGGDPSGVARFGELTPQQTDYAEAVLERPVFVRDSLGHDGKFLFIQANDPLLVEPTEHAIALDRPTYRSQRMLYPLIAGVLAGLDPHLILWTLIAVNLAMFGLGTWSVAMLAIDAGMTSWFGLAFAANMGLVYSLLMDGSTVTAFALACAGVLALTRLHTGLSVVAFTGAVLAREVMILFAVGVVAGLLVSRRRSMASPSTFVGDDPAPSLPWSIIVVPGLAAVLWAVYVRWRIDFEAGLIENEEIALVPFGGALDAVTSGQARLVDLISIALLIAVAVVVPILAFRTMSLLVWGAFPFSVLAIFLTVNVWQYDYNISRALIPLLTAVVFGLGLMLHRTEERSEPAPAQSS
jgi:hypothetical protein